jgi:hypothetical protein
MSYDAYVIAGKFTHAGYQISVRDVEMKRRLIGQARPLDDNAWVDSCPAEWDVTFDLALLPLGCQKHEVPVTTAGREGWIRSRKMN